jgi:hypothetical protein
MLQIKERTVFIFLYVENINHVSLLSDDMAEVCEGVEFEEAIEQNFLDEILSPPKASSQWPIGIYLHFAFCYSVI